MCPVVTLQPGRTEAATASRYLDRQASRASEAATGIRAPHAHRSPPAGDVSEVGENAFQDALADDTTNLAQIPTRRSREPRVKY